MRSSKHRRALSTISAVIASGVHLFPFRTEKLSPTAPMVLGAQAPGRVGRRRITSEGPRERPFSRSRLRDGARDGELVLRRSARRLERSWRLQRPRDRALHVVPTRTPRGRSSLTRVETAGRGAAVRVVDGAGELAARSHGLHESATRLLGRAEHVAGVRRVRCAVALGASRTAASADTSRQRRVERVAEKAASGRSAWSTARGSAT